TRGPATEDALHYEDSQEQGAEKSREPGHPCAELSIHRVNGGWVSSLRSLSITLITFAELGKIFIWLAASFDPLIGAHTGSILVETGDELNPAHRNWGCKVDNARAHPERRRGAEPRPSRPERLNNGRIKIWDVYTGKLLLNLVDHTEVVRDLTFAPDGSLILVSASRDKTLRVWDLKDDGNMMKVLRGHQNWVYSCAFSPDSSMLCSVGASKAVFLWNMDKYTMIRKLEGHHHDVVACDFSPDGALLATASYDTRVYIWDPHTGDILMEFGHLFPPPTPIFAGGANDRWVRSVSFSHDGLHVASLADDKMVRFWRIDEDYPVQVAPLSNGLCCAFSTDGSVLAAGTHDGSVYFWATPRQVPSLQHLCRMSIRRVMPTQEVQELPIPSKVLEFLSYRV
ncbi:hypothetical protein EI555_006542, partial [Monodon monoceros]